MFSVCWHCSIAGTGTIWTPRFKTFSVWPVWLFTRKKDVDPCVRSSVRPLVHRLCFFFCDYIWYKWLLIVKVVINFSCFSLFYHFPFVTRPSCAIQTGLEFFYRLGWSTSNLWFPHLSPAVVRFQLCVTVLGSLLPFLNIYFVKEFYKNN